jgi:hypothetical protein
MEEWKEAGGEKGGRQEGNEGRQVGRKGSKGEGGELNSMNPLRELVAWILDQTWNLL